MDDHDIMQVSSPCEGVYQTHARLTLLLSKWVSSGPCSSRRTRVSTTITAYTVLEIVPLLKRLDVLLCLGDRPRTADRRSRIPPRVRITLEVARVHGLTWYRCAQRETRHLRIIRIRVADARARSRKSPRARILRRRVASRCYAQLAKHGHVVLLFEIPQPCDAQRYFILFRDPRLA